MFYLFKYYAYFFVSYSSKVLCFDLNATGGTFPNSVYQESVFSYQFVDSDNTVTYYDLGSGCGKCNIMGYWQSSNTNPFLSSYTKIRDTYICTDKCNSAPSIAICGNDSRIYPRFDRNTRTPKVNFAGSDSILGAADYAAFPDLQMFPSLAGAVVPIYYIPELAQRTLVLSRTTIAAIFLGNIRTWNDPLILRDNSDPITKSILSSINENIKVAVRSDSSGTTEIFSTGLYSFDPPNIHQPDYSFANVVGKGPTPTWCGPLTDELQIITIKNCNASLSTNDKQIILAFITSNYTIQYLNFSCDITENNLKNKFDLIYGIGSILVTRTSSNNAMGNSYTYSIGYWGSKLTMMNWYQPYIINNNNPLFNINIITIQEGGYLNSHYNSSYFITPEIQSIWINTDSIYNNKNNYYFTFQLSYPGNPTVLSNVIQSNSISLLNDIRYALHQIIPYYINKVSKFYHSNSNWIEFQITFNMTSPNPQQPSLLTIHSSISDNILSSTHIIISRYQTGYNFPLFYDNTHVQGYQGSGKYTCYKHMHYLSPWSYYTGTANKGVIAEV